jgi:hypothetical protein
MTQTQELANRQTVASACQAYDEARQKILRAFEMVREAEDILNQTFGGGTSADLHLDVRNRWGKVNFHDPLDSMQEIDAQIWRVLVQRTEVKRFMSGRAAKELDDHITKHEMPPISIQAIHDMVASFQANRDQMLQEAVEEVFERLRPRGSKYKRNSEFEVPERVVLGRLIEKSWQGKLQPAYEAYQELRALENVFSSLDGKGSTTKQHYSDIHLALKAAGDAGGNIACTPYFEGRMFQNGNLHLKFLRPDLLARFNALAGGARLRAKPAA